MWRHGQTENSFDFVLSDVRGAGTVAYLNMGTSLIALGRCHEAASILRKGSKLDGNGLRDRTAHNNARISMLLQLGSLYVDQGKLQRALAVYRETLHSLPKNYPPQVCAMAFGARCSSTRGHLRACRGYNGINLRF